MYLSGLGCSLFWELLIMLQWLLIMQVYYWYISTFLIVSIQVGNGYRVLRTGKHKIEAVLYNEIRLEFSLQVKLFLKK